MTRCALNIKPENMHEARFLQGAACHGCLLIAETSCEQHNDFLDRALVVPTLENLGVEFFQPGGLMIFLFCCCRKMTFLR